MKFVQLEGAVGSAWDVYQDDLDLELDFPDMPRIDLPDDHPVVVQLNQAEIQRSRWQGVADGCYDEIGKLIHQQEIERGNR